MLSYTRLLIVFLFIAVPSKNIFAQEIINRDEAITLLQKAQILSSAEQSQLKKFVSQLEPKLYIQNDYEKLALAFSNKIKRDIKNLDSLSAYLHRMVENKFARKLGSVRESDIESIRSMIQKLDKQTVEPYEKKSLKQDRLNTTKLVKIIKRDAATLIGSGSKLTSADIWMQIKARFKGAYNKWNAEFVRLESSHISDDGSDEVYGNRPEKKKKFYELPREPQKFIKNAKPDPSQYDVEELQFMRDFSKIQVIFRRLSESNSDDF